MRRSQQISLHEVWKVQHVHEDARDVHRVEVLVRNFGNMETATSGRLRFDKESGQTGEVLIWCRKCSARVFCEAENGFKIDERLQTRARTHWRAWQDVETNSDPTVPSHLSFRKWKLF